LLVSKSWCDEDNCFVVDNLIFLEAEMKLSNSFSGALREFSYWIANGTVGLPLLEGIDYISVFREEPSLLEQAYAIFANVIEIDENGTVLNAKYAEKRAAQYIRQYCDRSYTDFAPFEEWEVELY
jgi:hypothetical protein